MKTTIQHAETTRKKLNQINIHPLHDDIIVKFFKKNYNNVCYLRNREGKRIFPEGMVFDNNR